MKRALLDASTAGVRNVHAVMTRFRAFYALEAERRFAGSGLQWEAPRDAWWGDYWFFFRGASLPQGAAIVHKATAGTVQLSFRNTNALSLSETLGHVAEQQGFAIVQTGKSAAVQIDVEPIHDFDNPGDKATEQCGAAFLAAERLLHIWEGRQHPLSSQHDSTTVLERTVRDQQSGQLLCLQELFEGLIRGRALEYGAPPVDRIPDLLELAQSPQKSHYLTVPGIAEGFQIQVIVDAWMPVTILAESGSRIHNGWLRHKLTLNNLESSSFDIIEDAPFESWFEACRQKFQDTASEVVRQA